MTDKVTPPPVEEENNKHTPEDPAQGPEDDTPDAKEAPSQQARPSGSRRRQRRRGGVRPGRKKPGATHKESGKEAVLRGAREALSRSTGVPMHTLEGDFKGKPNSPKQVLEGIPKLISAIAESMANNIRSAVLEQMAAHEAAQGHAPSAPDDDNISTDAASKDANTVRDDKPSHEREESAETEPDSGKDRSDAVETIESEDGEHSEKSTDNPSPQGTKNEQEDLPDPEKQKIPSIKIDSEFMKESAGEFFNSLLGSLMQVASKIQEATTSEDGAATATTTPSTPEGGNAEETTPQEAVGPLNTEDAQGESSPTNNPSSLKED